MPNTCSLLSRRNLLLGASYAALAALTGCKLRIENPLEPKYAYTGTFRIYSEFTNILYIDGVRHDIGLTDGK